MPRQQVQHVIRLIWQHNIMVNTLYLGTCSHVNAISRHCEKMEYVFARPFRISRVAFLAKEIDDGQPDLFHRGSEPIAHLAGKRGQAEGLLY
jgi:hypothetical protein